MRVLHKMRWLFTPQATSLLLVAAITMLSIVTLETRTAARQSTTAANQTKQQTVLNKTIIQAQRDSEAEAVIRTQQQAVANAQLAEKSIKALLAQEGTTNKIRDAQLQALLLKVQETLLAAISQLQHSLDTYARQDAQRDRKRNTPNPGPTCVPIPVLCQ